MRTSTQSWHASTPLKRLAMVFVVVLCVLIIGPLIEVFHTHPELRNPAAWLPYDRTAETTLSGVVADVQEFQCPWAGTDSGIHLALETEVGTVYVHSGDARYLRAHGAIFNRGDRIEVVGQKMSIGGEKALIAREFHRGGQRVAVRDLQGNPLWIQK